MLQRLISAAAIALFLLPAPQPVADPVPLDDKPQLSVWRADRHNQSGVYTDNGADGVAYRVTWNAGSRNLTEVVFTKKPAVQPWQPGMEASLWVRDQPAGSIKAMALRLVDASGETYQFGSRLKPNVDGWQKVTWTLDPAKAERVYGGDKNKQLNGEPRWLHILAITHKKPDAPVHLWFSPAEGGDVKAQAAAPPTAPTDNKQPAALPDHVQALAIDAPPATGALPVMLVNVTERRAIRLHAGQRRNHAASNPQPDQPWRELKWNAGAQPLMELGLGNKDLLAYDAGVTLSIPLDATGHPGLHKLAVRAVDANGETFQWPVRLNPNAIGWQDVRVTLAPDAFETSYGKNPVGKGVIDLPLKLRGLVLLAPNKSAGSVRLGHITRNAFDPNAISLQTRLAGVSIDIQRSANIPMVRADEQAPVVLQLKNSGAAEATFDLQLSFEHFDGSITPWSKPGVVLAGNSEQALEIPGVLTKTGWYRMDVTLAAGGSTVEKPEVPFVRLIPAGPREHPPAEGFWLGIDARIGNPKVNAWKPELAALIGADFLRMGQTWPRIQPKSAGSFDWSRFDAELALLDSHGLKAAYGLTFTPPWAIAENAQADFEARVQAMGLSLNAKGSASRLPPDPDAWRTFVREVAKRGSTKNIISYELWNEPDLSGFYRGTTDQFIELMRIASEEVRAHHPDAMLLSGGVATVGGHGGHNLNPDLTERSIVEGQDFYDVVCLHQHGHFDNFQQGLDGPMARYRAALREDKPMFFTETGTAVQAVGGSRHAQAHELVKKITFARARDAVGFIWFVLQLGHEDRYAMVTSGRNPTPFPAVAAYNELAKMMRGRTFERQHDLGPGAFVLEFKGQNDRLAVVWAQRPEAVGQNVLFAVSPGANAQLIDIMGNATRLETTTGLASITLSNDVHYVLLPGIDSSVAGTLASLEPAPAGIPGQAVEAAVVLRNPTDQPLSFDLTWSAPDNPTAQQSVTVPANTDRQRVGYRLSMPAGTRAGDDAPQLHFAYRITQHGLAGALQSPLRVAQLIPAEPMDSRKPDFVLNRLDDTIINVNQADPNRAQFVWTGPEDLAANIHLALEGESLVIRVAVSDDVHLQPNPAAGMWKADGLQFGFLLPGQSQAWEFGAGLHEQGPAAVTYRHAGAGHEDPAAAFQTTIEPTSGGLLYRLVIPCEALGTTAGQLRTQGMKFGLVVNDDDGGGREGWARISEGIARGKNPDAFPLVIFE
ncbi:MAG: hypothetical protein AAF797_14960 [Planctomycetota bacterium]